MKKFLLVTVRFNGKLYFKNICTGEVKVQETTYKPYYDFYEFEDVYCDRSI